MIRAALITEGKSDRGLDRVLERMCRAEGVDEIEVEWVNEVLQQLGSATAVRAKISALTLADPEFDLLFVHRDADKAGLEARRKEIYAASARCGDPWPLVAVIPIREIEAWLLVDGQKIREVVGNPKGTTPLGLPKLSRVEACADPKTTLRQALDLAVRKRKQKPQHPMKDAEFSRYRARLLEALDIYGPVVQLEAWTQLLADLVAARVDIELQE